MRISERKKQIRERSSGLAHQTEGVLVRERPAPRARVARPKKVAGQAARAPKSQQARAATARPARQRSPRFYVGFGMVGVVLSAVLAVSTVSSYNGAVSSYPAKLSQYHALMAAYQKALAHYHAVQGHGLTLPKAPTAPQQPSLTILSFALPLLYGLLSVAYLYLGYRASRGARVRA